MTLEIIGACLFGAVAGWTCCLIAVRTVSGGFTATRLLIFILIFACATVGAGTAAVGFAGAVWGTGGLIAGAAGYCALRQHLRKNNELKKFSEVEQLGGWTR